MDTWSCMLILGSNNYSAAKYIRPWCLSPLCLQLNYTLTSELLLFHNNASGRKLFNILNNKYSIIFTNMKIIKRVCGVSPFSIALIQSSHSSLSDACRISGCLKGYVILNELLSSGSFSTASMAASGILPLSFSWSDINVMIKRLWSNLCHNLNTIR